MWKQIARENIWTKVNHSGSLKKTVKRGLSPYHIRDLIAEHVARKSGSELLTEDDILTAECKFGVVPEAATFQ